MSLPLRPCARCTIRKCLHVIATWEMFTPGGMYVTYCDACHTDLVNVVNGTVEFSDWVHHPEGILQADSILIRREGEHP